MNASAQHDHWGLGLEGPDPNAAVQWFVMNVWKGRTPNELVVHYQSQQPTSDWRALMRVDRNDVVAAHFAPDRSESLIVHPSGLVTGRFPFTTTADAAQQMLEDAPFEVASFEPIRPWPASYRAPSFGRNHFPHGWGCAFKGDGHERLVSRRWIEFGPWVLTRGAHDLSLIQFHALDAPPKRALAQAKPAHRTMGISEDGGFLQRSYVFRTSLSGLYDATQQTLRIVVVGRDVTSVEMLDARAAVKQGRLSPDQPLRRVAYVFPKPDDARRHLHGLWLRELECWAVIDGVETRLDADYHPRSTPPDWAI